MVQNCKYDAEIGNADVVLYGINLFSS